VCACLCVCVLATNIGKMGKTTVVWCVYIHTHRRSHILLKQKCSFFLPLSSARASIKECVRRIINNIQTTKEEKLPPFSTSPRAFVPDLVHGSHLI